MPLWGARFGKGGGITLFFSVPSCLPAETSMGLSPTPNTHLVLLAEEGGGRFSKQQPGVCFGHSSQHHSSGGKQMLHLQRGKKGPFSRWGGERGSGLEGTPLPLGNWTLSLEPSHGVTPGEVRSGWRLCRGLDCPRCGPGSRFGFARLQFFRLLLL